MNHCYLFCDNEASTNENGTRNCENKADVFIIDHGVLFRERMGGGWPTGQEESSRETRDEVGVDIVQCERRSIFVALLPPTCHCLFPNRTAALGTE